MTPAEAAWVRAVAWRDHHRKTHAEYPHLYTTCDCERGRCGHCAQGWHRTCTSEHHVPKINAATYLSDRGGYVKALVWEAGHRHVWSCACKKAGHDIGPIQMTLF